MRMAVVEVLGQLIRELASSADQPADLPATQQPTPEDRSQDRANSEDHNEQPTIPTNSLTLTRAQLDTQLHSLLSLPLLLSTQHARSVPLLAERAAFCPPPRTVHQLTPTAAGKERGRAYPR